MNTPLFLSKRILEILPPIVHRIRAEARIAVRGKLTLPQFRILANVKQGMKTVGVIAETQGVAQPTISKMVDGLVKRGLIKRVADENDRRQINLILSKKGMDLFSEGIRSLQLHLSQNFRKIDASDREKLAKALDQVDEILLKSLGAKRPALLKAS